jgi:diguanylate cyclase (GGDEF)-like protein/PAS domain S-box-containing protein
LEGEARIVSRQIPIEDKESDPPPIRVLMVEDSAPDVELVLRQLKRDGLHVVNHVVIVEDEFRQALSKFSPQLILSDFSLPKFDGISALRIARAEAPAIPFIFVSGTIGEERAIEALKNGASDYVLKENLRRLVPAIRGAMREREATRARDQAEELLRHSESRLQDIINTSADWIWECDKNHHFTFSSPGIAQLLGYNSTELLKTSAFIYVEPADHERLHMAFATLEDDATTSVPVVLRWKRKDGHVRWLERKMIPLRDESGELRGYRGIDRDVTMRRTQEERIARLNRAVRFLGGTNSAIVRIRDRLELLREACRLAVQVGQYTMATVYLADVKGGEPTICRAVHDKHQQAKRPTREPLDGPGPVGRAMATGELVIVPNLNDKSVEIPDREALLSMGMQSCIAIPLSIDGTTIGVTLLHADETHVFSDSEVSLLRQVTGNITFSLQYMHSKESIEFLAYFDTLTALANRTLYLQRLVAAIKAAEHAGQGIALIVFDLAGLTVINDGLGHHAGDLVLQLVAERLKNVFRDSNCLCHLGGGRFAVCSTYPREHTAAPTVLRERVDFLFDAPFVVNDQEIRLALRAGFAEFPDNGQDAEALLHHAQTALAHAKRSGESFMRHSPEMNVAASERLSLTNRLRGAAAKQDFLLHYQPKMSLADGSVDGVEALLRWPDGGVSPAVFIPLLESIGLIGDVGNWVLVRALSEGIDWRRNDSPGHFRIAVNISALQLRRENFAEEVLTIANTIPGGTSRLELEVTESMLMADPRRATEVLSQLREAGVTVAIDDFGTGHSSLQLLSRLPVDVLKIDRSFVRDLPGNPRDLPLVQATITLAKSLGLRTVAEGVETEDQAAILKELGCDAIQGYLVMRPAPAHEMSTWLAAYAPPGT